MIKIGKPDGEGSVRVTFVLPASEPAGPVSVVGDFNEWDPLANPLRKRANGTRTTIVKLPVGSRSHFRYLGQHGLWFDDEAGASLAV